MNKTKKVFLSSGIILTTLPTVAVVVSCGDNDPDRQFEAYYDYKKLS